jgi:hypothetical protein
MQIDTETMLITMPEERMQQLSRTLPLWAGKTAATKQEYQQLIGVLSWTCFGIAHARTFLRRLFDAIKGVPFQSSVIPLSVDSQADIARWIKYGKFYFNKIKAIVFRVWFITDCNLKSKKN